MSRARKKPDSPTGPVPGEVGATRKPLTTGFGVPESVDPHHWIVAVPSAKDAPVRIVEHFGISAAREGAPDEIDRAELSRAKWQAIAEPLRKLLNERLQDNGLIGSRWSVGDNKVERLLGKELCILAWALEHASEELVPVAVTNWAGLKPEERWWLFTMTAAATGRLEDGDRGWRKALRFALTENPTTAEAERQIAEAQRPRPRPRAPTTRGRKRTEPAADVSADPLEGLPLFGLMGMRSDRKDH